MRKIGLAVALLFFTLFVAGCVRELPASQPQSEALFKTVTYDSTGSGTPDTFTYVFEPWEYNNLTIQRILVAKQHSVLQQEKIAAPNFTSDSAQAANLSAAIAPSSSEYKISIGIDSLLAIRSNLQSYLSSKAGAEAECRRILGLDRSDLPCVDMASCAKACYTPICQPFAQGAGEPFVKSLLDLNTASKSLETEVNSAINLVDLMSSDVNNIKPGDIELLANRFSKIRELASTVNRNDILNPSAYALCAPFNYQSQLITDSEGIAKSAKIKVTFQDANNSLTLSSPISFVSTPVSESDYYDYTNIFLVSSNSTASQLKSFTLDDSLPSKLNVPLETVTYPTNYSSLSQFPLSVKFSIVEIGGSGIGRTLSYSFKSKVFAGSSFATSSVSTPAVSLSVVSLYSMPIVSQLLQNSNVLYAALSPSLGFYLALAILAFLFFVLVGRLLWTALRFVYAIFNGLVSKMQMSSVIYDFAGHANRENNVYFAVGLLLLAVGFYLSQGPAVELAGQAIDPDTIISVFSQDPFRAFGFVLFLFGLISIYLVVEDILKGVVLGKKYTTIPSVISHNDNVERFNRLVSLTKECEALIGRAAQANIDTSNERQALHSIPYTHIRNLVESGEEEAAFVALERYVSKIEGLNKDLNEKVVVVKENSARWVEIVGNSLKLHKEVASESLVDIPVEWRKQALEEYLALHKDENLKLEAGVLKRVKDMGASKAQFDFMLESMKKEKLIDSGLVVLRDGAVLASKLPVSANITVISAMSVKMVKAAFGFSRSLRLGNVHHTLAITKGAKILTVYNDAGLFMCTLSPQASVTKVVEKAREVLEHLKDVLV
ncbi:MAG: hypothetical protein WC506_05810 [Candidatus Micrarchaeia archaeon]